MQSFGAKGRAWAALLMVSGLLGGCTHLKGVAVDDRFGKPMPTARFTVGRPNGIAVYATHDVDAQGRFDFYVGPTDDNQVYVFDSDGSPEQTMERLDSTEIGEKMKIRVHRAGAGGNAPSFGVGP